MERKKRCKNGERTSKMVSFRADDETIAILNLVPNKGRFINFAVQSINHQSLTERDFRACENILGRESEQDF